MMSGKQAGNLSIISDDTDDEADTSEDEIKVEFKENDTLKLITLFHDKLQANEKDLDVEIDDTIKRIVISGKPEKVNPYYRQLKDCLSHLVSETCNDQCGGMSHTNRSVLTIFDHDGSGKHATFAKTQSELDEALEKHKKSSLHTKGDDRNSERRHDGKENSHSSSTPSRRAGRKFDYNKSHSVDNHENDGSDGDTQTFSKEQENTGNKSPWTNKKHNAEKGNNDTKASQDKRGPDKYRFSTTEGLVVRLYRGSIIKLHVDAVVNAANDELDNCGGVAKVISEGAGREMDKECRDIMRVRKKLNVAENIVTGAGNLPCKYVIHAVGPNWHNYHGDDVMKGTCLSDLSETVKNVLITANRYSCTRIVMPPISSGIFGVPLPMCAAMYLKGIMDFSQSRRSDSVKELHIIDIKDDVLDLIESLHKNMREDTLDPMKIISKYPSKQNTRGSYSQHGERSHREHQRYDKGHDTSKHLHQETERPGTSSGWTKAEGTSGGRSQSKDGNPGQNYNRQYSNSNDRQETRQASKGGHDSSTKQSNSRDWHQQQTVMNTQVKGQKMTYQLGHVTINIFTADIVTLQGIHGLVSTDNPSMSPQGRLSSTIFDKAGDKYQNEYKKLTPSKRHALHTVLVSTAGDLSYKRVFHAITLQMPRGRAPSTRDLDNLAEVVLRVLLKADELVFTWKIWKILKPESLAMPLLMAGSLKDPHHIRDCCLAMLNGIYDFILRPFIWKINEVNLVNMNPVFTSCLQDVFTDYFKKNRGSVGPFFNLHPFPDQKIGYLDAQANKSPPNEIVQGGKIDHDKRSSANHKHTDEKLRRGHRQFGVTNPNHVKKSERPWQEDRDKKGGEIPNKPRRGFDPSQYRYVETWKGNEDVHEDTDFDEWIKPLKKQKPIHQKGNLMILDEDDDGHAANHMDMVTDTEYGDCVICMSAMDDPVKLLTCGHTFCRECITEYFKMKTACPVCGHVYGNMCGDQPLTGKANVYEDEHSLPGNTCSTLIIVYDFPDGTQDECHPDPGKPYKGLSRQAYLPHSQEGLEILQLLKKAFMQRLTFTVGSSRTTGKDNVVTWNDIHHKTRREGGPQRFGYPDPEYLDRVRDELKAKGIE